MEKHEVEGLNYSGIIAEAHAAESDPVERARIVSRWEEGITPHIGCPAQVIAGGDRDPYEVVRVGRGASRSRIWVRPLAERCYVTSLDGTCKVYSFYSDESATVYEARWSKKRGCWVLGGTHTRIKFDAARYYRSREV